VYEKWCIKRWVDEDRQEGEVLVGHAKYIREFENISKFLVVNLN
jgi:predicted ThiF/HesA family dinucleotide-utilizing enzyme